MDFDLLPQLIIVFSVAGILFIVGKNFSKVKEASQEQVFSEESEKEKREKEKFLYLYERATRRINKENYHKKMAEFWVWFEKFLRRIRLIVMKLDGRIVAALEHLRQKNVKSVEELKKMAETAEKNIQKRPAFLGGKGAFKKLRKIDADHLDIKTPEEGLPVGTDDDAAMPLADAEAVLYEDKTGSSYIESYSVPIEGQDMREPEEEYREAEYAKSERSAGEKQEAVLDEYLPEDDTDSNDEPAAERKTEIASMIERIDEFAEELQDTELFRDSQKEEKAETSTGYETLGEEPSISDNPEEDNVRTKKEQECIDMLMNDPADIKAYWRLGIIYSKRRNYEDALACFRQIVKIDPTYTKAKQKVIEVMEKMRKRGK